MTRRLHPRGIEPGTEGTTLKTQSGIAQWVPDGITVQDENTTVASGVTQLDFQGSGVNVTAGSGEVVVSIDSGSGNSAYSPTASTLMSRSTIQNVLGSTWTAVTWDQQDEDFFGAHSTTTNPTRWVCGASGLYTFSTTITSTTGNFFFVQFAKNGTRIGGRVSSAGGGAPSAAELTRVLRLGTGDYIEVFVYSATSWQLAGRDTYSGQEDYCTWSVTSAGRTRSSTDQTAARTVRFTDAILSPTFPGTAIVVDGLTISNVSGGRTVLVSAGVSQSLTHGCTFSIWVDGVHHYPTPGSIEEIGVLTTSSRYQMFMSSVPITLSGGSHTIEVRTSTTGVTTSVTWYDRYLVVEDGSGMGNTIDTTMPNFFSSKTDGDVVLNSATFTDIDSALDLVIPAEEGDFIEVEMQVRASAGSATALTLDFHTIVSGSPVHSISTGGVAGTTSTGGVPNWECDSVQTSGNGFSNLSGSRLYQVQATDLASGNVRLRLRGYSGGSVTLAASDPQLYVQAKNLRIQGGGVSTGLYLLESGGTVPPGIPVETIIYEKA